MTCAEGEAPARTRLVAPLLCTYAAHHTTHRRERIMRTVDWFRPDWGDHVHHSSTGSWLPESSPREEL